MLDLVSVDCPAQPTKAKLAITANIVTLWGMASLQDRTMRPPYAGNATLPS